MLYSGKNDVIFIFTLGASDCRGCKQKESECDHRSFESQMSKISQISVRSHHRHLVLPNVLLYWWKVHLLVEQIRKQKTCDVIFNSSISQHFSSIFESVHIRLLNCGFEGGNGILTFKSCKTTLFQGFVTYSKS